MRNYKIYLLIAVILISVGSLNAQTINWASLQKEHKHILNVNVGAEYGIIYGVGYNYHIRTKLFEILPDVEYSFPSGNKIMDDFKAKIGAQVSWFEYCNFRFNTRLQGIFRREKNDFVRLLNFGSDIAGVIGYYRLKWFVSGEVGFDKAIVTNFKHSEKYRAQFPDVVDGWYEPPTGGNFYFGGQAGYSFKKHDLYLRGGKILNQDFKTKPLLPIYLQLGYNIKFEKLKSGK